MKTKFYTSDELPANTLSKLLKFKTERFFSHFIFTLLPLTLLYCSNLNGQVFDASLSSGNLSICGESQTITITFENDSGATITFDSIFVDMSNAINFELSDFTQISGPPATFDVATGVITTPNDPLADGTVLELELTLTGLCGAQTEPEILLNFVSNQFDSDFIIIDGWATFSPNLSIIDPNIVGNLRPTQNVFDAAIGVNDTLKVPVTNAGQNSFLGDFVFFVVDPTSVDLVDVMFAGSTLSPIGTSGDTIFYSIDSSLFPGNSTGGIDNSDEFLGFNESVVICEIWTGQDCSSSTPISHGSQFECSGSPLDACQQSNIAVTGVSYDFALPDLVAAAWAPLMDRPACYAEEAATMAYIITNNGEVPAVDVTIDALAIGNGTLIPGSFSASLTEGGADFTGVVSSITDPSAGQGCSSGGTNVGSADATFEDVNLAPGDTLFITLQTMHGCNCSGCSVDDVYRIRLTDIAWTDGCDRGFVNNDDVNYLDGRYDSYFQGFFAGESYITGGSGCVDFVITNGYAHWLNNYGPFTYPDAYLESVITAGAGINITSVTNIDNTGTVTGSTTIDSQTENAAGEDTVVAQTTSGVNGSIQVCFDVDCGESGGGCPNTASINLINYLVTDPTCTCKDNVSCNTSIQLVFDCPPCGPCDGLSIVDLDICRVNFGEYDANNDGAGDGVLANENSTGVKKNIFIAGDTLKATLKGVVNDGTPLPTPHLWDFAFLNMNMNTDEFTILGGELSVLDASTGNTLSCDVLSQFVNPNDSASMITDISVGSMTGLGCSDFNGFQYADGDSLYLCVFYTPKEQLVNTQSTPYIYTPEWYLSDADFGLGSIDNCNFLVETLNQIGVYYYQDPVIGGRNFGGCETSPFWHQTRIHYGALNFDEFCNEIRVPGIPEKYTFVKPPEFAFVPEEFGIRIREYTGTDTEIVYLADGSLPQNFFSINGDTLCFFAEDYIESLGDIPIDEDVIYWFYPAIQGNCLSTVGTYQSCSEVVYDVDDNVFCQDNYVYEYTCENWSYTGGPVLEVNSITPVVTVFTQSGCSEVQITNVTNIDAPFTFLDIFDVNGGLVVTSVIADPTGAATNVPVNAFGIFEIGDFPAGETIAYEVCVNLTDCTDQQLEFTAGWDCVGYPTTVEEALCAEPSTVDFISVDGGLDIALVSPSGPVVVELCDTLDYLFSFSSNQLGYLNEIIYSYQLPQGMEYVPGTFGISYPVPISGDTSCVNVADPNNLFDNLWRTEITSLDSTLDSEGLIGSLGSADNLNIVLVKFRTVTNCDFLSGSRPRFSSWAFDACGNRTPRLTLAGPRVYINNAIPEYDIAINLGTLEMNACENEQETVAIDMVIAANPGVETSVGDSVSIALPLGINYVPTSYNAISNAIGGLPVTQTSNGQTTLIWPIQEGLVDGDVIQFELDIITEDVGQVCMEYEMLVSTYSVTNATCGDVDCNIGVLSGDESVFISIVKPELVFQNFDLNLVNIPPSNQLLEYTFTVCNDGSVDSTQPIVIDFYADNDESGLLDTVIDNIATTITENITVASGTCETVTSSQEVSAGSICKVLAVIDANNNCTCEPEVSNQINASIENQFETEVELCSGDILEVGPANVTGFDYEWLSYNGSNLTALSSTTTSPVDFQFSNTSGSNIVWDYVIRTSFGSCFTYDTLTVTVFPENVVEVSIAACEGESYVLSGSATGSNFSWSPTTDLDDPNISFPTLSPVPAWGVYTLSYTDEDGCNASREVTINGIACAPNTAIGDTVWFDIDENGLQDVGEPGIPGVAVYLYYSTNTSAGSHISATTTDANGYYDFTGLPAGNYVIGFVDPAGFFTTTTDVTGGPDTDDSDAGAGGLTDPYFLPNGVFDQTVDAGFIPDCNLEMEVSLVGGCVETLLGYDREFEITISWTNAVFTEDFLDGQDNIVVDVNGTAYNFLITELSGDTTLTYSYDISGGTAFSGSAFFQSDSDCATTLDVTNIADCVYDLALIKDIDAVNLPSPYGYGSVIPFIITLENQGSNPLTNVLINDYLPAGYSFQASLNSGWSAAGAGLLNYTETSIIAPGGTIDIPLNLTLQQGSGATDWLNYAEIGAMTDTLNIDRSDDDIDSTPDNIPTNDAGGSPDTTSDDVNDGDSSGNFGDIDPLTDEDDHDPENLQVIDLALIKEIATPLPTYCYGDSITFDITIYNQGNVTANNIVINDSIPSGYSWLASNEPIWSYATPLATTTLTSPLLPGTSTTISMTLTIEQVLLGNYTNIAEIGSFTDMAGADISGSDIDSTPNTDFRDDAGGNPNGNSDNVADGDGTGPVGSNSPSTDEDDADPAIINRLVPKCIVSSDSPVCFGEDLVLQETSGFADSWEWYGPNGFTDNVQNLVVVNPDAGMYGVVITDINGFISDTCFVNVIVSGEILVQKDSINVACNGEANGSIDLDVIGGTPPYTYDWDNDGFEAIDNDFQDLLGLAAGTYTVVITDAVGCTDTASVDITEPLVLSCTASVTMDGTCSDASTGEITVTAFGGTLPYSYSANGMAFQPGNVIENLVAGTYTLTVEDANGCRTTCNATIDSNNLPSCYVCANPATLDWANESWLPGETTNDYQIEDTDLSFTVTDNSGSLVNSPVSLPVASPFYQGDQATINTTLLIAADLNILQTTNSIVTCFDIGTVGVGADNVNFSLFDVDGELGAFLRQEMYVITGYLNGVPVMPNITGTAVHTITGNQILGNTPTVPSGGNSADGTVDISFQSAVDQVCIDFSVNPGSIINLGGQPGFGIFNINFCSINNYCSGEQIQLSESGGDAVSWSWTSDGGATFDDSNSQNPTVDNVVDDEEFTVVITDANGCTSNCVTKVLINDLPNCLISFNAPLCNGDDIVLNEIGADGVSWAWSSNGAATFSDTTIQNPTVTGAIDGEEFTVIVTDINDCESNCIATYTEPLVLSCTAATTVNVGCFGETTGEITVTATGGTLPYLFSANGMPFQPGNVLTNLAVGTYTLTVEDANGCRTTCSATITGPTAALSCSTTTTDASDCSIDNGTISVTATGGTMAYSYSIDGTNFQPTAIFTGLSAGMYTVTVRDNNGCETLCEATIAAPDAPMCEVVSTTDITCFGAATGALEVSATGGSGNYEYSSDGVNFQPTGVFTGLIAGTYNITVRNVGNPSCTSICSVVITELDELECSLTGANLNCNADNSGTITVTALGGSGDFEYSIDNTNFQIVNTFTGLAAGNYIVTTRDENNSGCFVQCQISLIEPIALSCTLAETNVLCNGDDTGSINVTAAGGTAPYVYSANGSPYQPGNTFNNLVAGAYVIEVQDANGCISTCATTITEPTLLVCNAVGVDASDCEIDNGSIAVVGAGGAGAPYAFSIDGTNFQATGSFTGLGVGTYTVTVRDINGCESLCEAIIDAPEAPLCEVVSTTNIACFGAATGEIVVTASGGSGNYEYSDDGVNFQASGTFASLTAGNYTITVRNVGNPNCTSVCTVVLTELDELECQIIGTDLLCNADNTGEIFITSIGGSGDFEYSIDGVAFQLSNTFTGLAAGAYTITTRDENNPTCTVQCTITLNEPVVLSCSLTATDALCNGNADGTITVAVSGGTTPYNFSVDGGPYQPGNMFMGLLAGSHEVTVRDDNGCLNTCTITIGEPAVLSCLTAVLDATDCETDDGTITVAVSGGTTVYSYSLNGGLGQASNEFTGLAPGTYLITVTDANDCETTCDATIVAPEVPMCEITGTTNVSCFGLSDGTLTVIGTGGTGSYEFSVDGGPFQTSGAFTGLAAGIHTVTVTNAGDLFCTSTCTVEITEPELLTCLLTTTPESCVLADGTVTVVPTGGTYPYSYSLDGAVAVTDSIFTGLTPNTYTVDVTDANGCTTQCIIDVEPDCFDLALTKVVAATQVTPITPGDTVTYSIVVFNQGTLAAYNIEIVDYIPADLILADPDWLLGLGGLEAFYNEPGPIAPGTSDTIEVDFIVDPAFPGGPIDNTAEISDADDDTDSSNGTSDDYDSDPDNDPDNDGPVTDDDTDNTNGDEDDADPANIYVYVTDLVVTKEITNISGQNADGSYDVTYTLTVTNIGVLDNDYDLYDLPTFDNDIAINSVSFTSDVPSGSTLTAPAPATGWQLADDVVLVTGGTHTYTLDYNISIDLDNTIAGGDGTYTACGNANGATDPLAGEGLFNEALLDTNNDGTPDQTAEACGDIPILEMEKTITSLTETNLNCYDVVYTITVENLGGATGTYDLDDNPGFDDDFTITQASFVTNAASALDGVLPNIEPWTLANDQDIIAGKTDTYIVTVSVCLDLEEDTATGDATYAACGDANGATEPTAGEGLYNLAILDTNNDGIAEDTSDVCVDVPYLVLTKTVVSVTDLADGTYDIEYLITVENIGGDVGTYSLYDLPNNDDDIFFNTASFTSDVPSGSALIVPAPATPGWLLASGQTIPADSLHSYSVFTNVSIDLAEDSTDDGDNMYTACGSNATGIPTAGEGVYNEALLDANNDGTIDETEFACEDLPFLVLTKEIESITGPNADGSYDVVYEIVVENLGGGSDIYNLFDLPSFDNDIVINTASFSSDVPSGSALTVPPVAPNGWTLGTGVNIPATTAHTYTLEMNVTLDLLSGATPGDGEYTACGETSGGGLPVAGEGLFNQAMIDTNDDNTPDQVAETCGDIGLFDLALIKQLAPTQPTPVEIGDVVDYVITIYNQGTIDAYNIEVVDYVPTGFDVTDANWSAGVNPSEYFTTYAGPLVAGDSVQITLSTVVNADAAGGVTPNYAEINGSVDENGDPQVDDDSTPDNDNENDGDYTDDSTDGTDGDEDDHDPADIFVQIFDLALNKTLSDATELPMASGDTIAFDITVTNQGNVDAYNVEVTDYLPAYLMFEPTLNSTMWLADPLGALFNEIEFLAVGGDTIIEITVIIDPTFQGDMIENTAEISDADDDDDPTNDPPTDVDSDPDNDNDDPEEEDDHDGEEYPLGQVFDLALIKQLAPTQATPVEIGDVVEYIITVYNQGTLDAFNIEVVDYVPTGLTITDTDWSVGANPDEYYITYAGPLAAGDSIEIPLTAVINADAIGGDMQNFAEIYAADDDTDPTNDPPNDPDSDSDSDSGNDGDYTDDSTDGTDGDEDDHDPADIFVQIFDLALNKTLSDATELPMASGDTIAFDITVTNQGNVDAYNVAVTDYLPAYLMFEPTLNSTMWLADPLGALFNEIEFLAVGGDTIIEITVIIDPTFQGDMIENTAEISDADDDDDPTNDPPTDVDSDPDNDNDDPEEEDDHDGEEYPLGQVFDLALIKQLAPTQATPVEIGDVVEYIITVYNQGTLDAFNIEVVDYVPTGLTITDTDWSVGANPDEYYITYAGPLAAGDSIEIPLTAVINADAIGGDMQNFAEIYAADDDTDPTNDPPNDPDSDSDSDSGNDGDYTDDSTDGTDGDEDDHDPADIFVQIFDLALDKTLDSNTALPLEPGSTLTFNITVTNEGNVDAYNVEVTDYLPSYLILNDSNWSTIAAGALFDEIAYLAVGADTILQITVDIDSAYQGNVVENTAEISDADDDDDPTNDPPTDVDSDPDNDNDDPEEEDDHDGEEYPLGQVFDLALIKQLSPGQSTDVSVGDIVSYEITIYNQGTIAAYNIEVVDHLPAGMSNVDPNWTTGGFATTEVFTLVSGPLLAGDSMILTIDAMIDEMSVTGSFENIAEISDVEDAFGNTPLDIDSDPDNDPNNDGNPTDDAIDGENGDEDDSDSAIINVDFYDLALTKSILSPSDGMVTIGDQVTFEFEVYNQGSAPVTNVTITDYIPSGLLLVDENWTTVSGTEAFYTITDIIPANSSYTVRITFTVLSSAISGDIINYGEISNFTDVDGDSQDDADSRPDTDPENDGASKDDEINEDGTVTGEDEDDHDRATITFGYFDLALNKTLAGGQAGPFEPGDDVIFAITVYNQGTIDATNVTIVDYIQGGFILNDADWILTGGNEANYIIPGVLQAGTQVTVNITLQIAPDLSVGGTLNNFAEIADATGPNIEEVVDIDSDSDDDNTNDGPIEDDAYNNENGDEDDHDIESIQVERFDLALVKSLTVGQVEPFTIGDTISYDITVLNQGSVTATNVQVVDYVPLGLALLTPSVWTGSATGNVFTTISGPILPGTLVVQTVHFVITEEARSGSLTNYAEITEASDENGNPQDDIDSEADSNPDNDGPVTDGETNNGNGDEDDHDPETIEISVFDLALIKELAPGQSSVVSQGDMVDYLITVTNQGSIDAYNVSIMDYIPAGFTLADTDWTALSASQAEYMINGPIPVGGDIAIEITLEVGMLTAEGDYINFAEITGGTNEEGVPQEDLDSDADDDPTNDGEVVNDETDGSNGDEDDHDSEVVTVSPLPVFDLALTKTLAPGQPSTVQPGDLITYTFTIFNQGSVDATNVEITDTYPAGLTLVDGAWTDLGGNQASYTYLGLIPAGGNQSINVSFELNSNVLNTSLTNFGEISGATDTDGNPQDDVDSDMDDDPNNDGTPDDNTIDNSNEDQDDHDSETITIEVYDLALTKSLASGQSSTVSVGDDINFVISVTNQGNMSAYNVQVVDYVPSGLSLNDENWTLDIAGNAYTTIAGPIPPQATVNVFITLTVGESVAAGDNMNIAEITNFTDENNNPQEDIDSNPDNNPTNDGPFTDDAVDGENGNEDDSDPAGFTVAEFDLALTKSLPFGAPNSYNVGDQVSYIIQVYNQGDIAATNVVITDYLPAGLTNIDPNWVSSGTNTVQTTITAVIQPGDVYQVQIVTEINANANEGSLVNFAEISGATDEDGNPQEDIDSSSDELVGNDFFDDLNGDDNIDSINGDEDDHDPAIITVGANYVDIELSKSVSQIQVTAGDIITYTLEVINKGPMAATSVTVSDVLPAGLQYLSANGNYDPSFGTWNIGTLGVNETATLDIDVEVLFIDDAIVNVAEVDTHDQEDIDSTPGDNGGSELVTDFDDEDSATIYPSNDPDPEVECSDFANNSATLCAYILANPTSDLALADCDNGGVNNITECVTGGDPFNPIDDCDNPIACEDMNVCTEAMTPVVFCPEFCIPGSVTNGIYSLYNCSVVELPNGCIQYTPLPGMETIGSDLIEITGTAPDGSCVSLTVNMQVGGCSTQIDLELSKSVDNANVSPGETVNYTIQLVNNGPDAADNVVVSDVLPAGLQFVSASSGLYNSATGNWSVPSIAADAMLNLVITAVVTGEGTIVNTVQVTAADGDDSDSTPNNNNSSEDDQDTAVITSTADCVNETESYCLGHMEAMNFCPEFCEFGDGTPYTITTEYTITDVSSIYHCSIYIYEDYCFRYIGLPGFFGSDVLIVTATDIYGNEAQIQINIEVSEHCDGSNTEPIATDDYESTYPNIPATINPLPNDIDADGDGLTVCDYTQPANGTVALVDGEFVYTSNGSFEGTTTFTYTICDGEGGEDTATITIDVAPYDCVNEPLYTCTAPFTRINICPDFCHFDSNYTIYAEYEIVEVNSLYDCSIDIISDECVSYIPLPGLSGTDVITIIAVNNNGEVSSVDVHIEIYEECPEVNNGRIGSDTPDTCVDEMPDLLNPNELGISRIVEHLNNQECLVDKNFEILVYNVTGQIIMNHTGVVGTANAPSLVQEKQVTKGTYIYQVILDDYNLVEPMTGSIIITK